MHFFREKCPTWTVKFINYHDYFLAKLNNKSTVIKRKAVVSYNTTSPSAFDGRCIKGRYQITLWNRGRNASKGKPLQKDWFNHYTNAIWKAQDKLGLSNRWNNMKLVSIPKNYKSKCKKITIDSMKPPTKKIEVKEDIVKKTFDVVEQIDRLTAENEQLRKDITKLLQDTRKPSKRLRI